MAFSASNGSIFFDSQKASIKGTNWFGFETNTFCPHGIWSVSMDSCLDFLQQNRFNALRVPFSLELALALDTTQPTSINYAANPQLEGKTAGQVLDALVAGCAARGILVMPVMHHLKAGGGITELWYGDGYTEAEVITGWLNLVQRYSSVPTVFAADIKNEPHGAATWGDSSPSTDWNHAAERIGNAILAANPALLIVVEGIATAPDGQGSWWGGAVAWAMQSPVQFAVPDRVVYSPHVYGPSVFQQSYFSDPTFPANLPPIWNSHWASLLGTPHTVMIGEWGGWCHKCQDPKDITWHQALAAFIASNNVNSFYWCLNPNSGDTGGLLGDDWTTSEQGKLDLLVQSCPSPTEFPKIASVAPTPTPIPTPGSGFAPLPTPVVAPPPTPTPTPTPISTNVPTSANSPDPCPPPPPALASSSQLSLSSTRANTWSQDSTSFFQLNVKVSNVSSAVAGNATIAVAPMTSITQSWNVTPTPTGFAFPEWLISSGGLQPGQSFEFGFICSGSEPSLAIT